MRLVDADALNKEFRDFVRASNNSDFEPTPTWNDAVSLVGSAPTVDAVPVRHGHWDFIPSPSFDGEREYHAHCSECGYHEHAYTIRFVADNWLYCPHCGAKMDEKDDRYCADGERKGDSENDGE